MERIDKVISSQTDMTRSDVKKYIKRGLVTVNGKVVDKSQFSVDPVNDKIVVDGEELTYKKYVYLVLNKPKGYVSATTDGAYPTVVELAPVEFSHREIFPCGRLDKDTTGLMILSDDGNFAHDILSPKKHVSKEYYVEIDKGLTEEMVIAFRDGVLLNDGECKSSELKIIDKRSCYVTLTEGRYHQIKRMFGCFGAEVLELKRIRMGNYRLPNDLEEGESRELTEVELSLIKEK